MNPRKAGCFLAAFLIAIVPLAAAQGTYTQIDVPGALQTGCFGINTAGDVVGLYQDSSGKDHGFLLSGGVYTTIDYPGAAGTVASGINDLGKIVGPYFPSTGGVSGYLYDVQTQTFTKISFAGAKDQTEPASLNNAGTIVGTVFLPRGSQYFPVGFELTGGGFQRVVPPGFNSSYVNGISNTGEAVGCAYTQTTCSTFLFNQGNFQRVKIPDTYVPYGTNISGAIVGVYPTHGTQYGFLYQNNALQKIVFPGSFETTPMGINDAGAVVGEFN